MSKKGKGVAIVLALALGLGGTLAGGFVAGKQYADNQHSITWADQQTEFQKVEDNLSKVKEELVRQQNDCKSLKDEISQLEAEKNSLLSDKENNTSRIAELESQISNLERSVSEKENEIKNLQEQINSLLPKELSKVVVDDTIDMSAISDFNGRHVWSDGSNVYYSGTGSDGNFILQDGRWVKKSWSVSIAGHNVWHDGSHTYHSSGRTYEFIDDDWVEVTWDNSPGRWSLSGQNVFSNGSLVVCCEPDGFYALNGKSWKRIWTDLPDNCGYVWTDGEHLYVASGSTSQYVLDGDSWVKKVWEGYDSAYAKNIWSDGTNIYLSLTWGQYILRAGKWVEKSWDGIDNFSGEEVWSDGENFYIYSNGQNYKFS